jgi:hypothetical protein
MVINALKKISTNQFISVAYSVAAPMTQERVLVANQLRSLEPSPNLSKSPAGEPLKASLAQTTYRQQLAVVWAR